jgi:ATP-dependent Clp protease ATP-binding subunit ClpC
MFERFTDRARKTMALANQEAQRLNHEYIDTEHILLGLVKEGAGVGANVLKRLGVDLDKTRREVEKLIKTPPKTATAGKLPQTSGAKRVIEYAIQESRNLGHNYVGTEHLLLGLLLEHNGIAAQVLVNLGLKLHDIREEVINMLGGPLPLTPLDQRDRGLADVKGLEEFFKDDAAAGLLQQLIHECAARRDQAILRADYELAAAYRDVLIDVQSALQRLGSILSRKKPLGD